MRDITIGTYMATDRMWLIRSGFLFSLSVIRFSAAVTVENASDCPTKFIRLAETGRKSEIIPANARMKMNGEHSHKVATATCLPVCGVPDGSFLENRSLMR